jgi:hypothetical protein
MLKDSTQSLLLQNLFELLEDHRGAFRQERTFLRALALVMAELFTFARHTVTQGMLALGLTDGDLSAWYRLFSRARFHEERVVQCLFEQTLAHVSVDQPYVIGVDGMQVPRSSQKMPGTSWLKAPGTAPFMPGIHRAQRFVNGSWLLPLAEGFSRAIPLRFLPAFTEKAVLPPGLSSCKEWEAGLTFITWVRQRLDALERKLQLVLVLADGAYDKVEFWKGLPENCVAAVRTAKNRVLRELPGAYQGKGKPRKYGPKVKAPKDWLHQKGGWQKTRIQVRGRVRELTYRVEGPFLRERAPERPLFLIVQKGNTWISGKKEPKRKQRKPCYYLVSAVNRSGKWVLPLEAEALVSWLWQRWELEVTHRELKSGLGLGEKQCWNPCSAVTSVQWSAWVYALLVLAGYRTWGLFGGPKAPGRWWRGGQRWSLATLWRAYRADFWGTSEFRAIWTPTSDNWLKKEAWMIALWNSVAASARI